MSSHVLRYRQLAALVAVIMLVMAGTAQARLFKLTPLSPEEAGRLKDTAKDEYEQGLNWVSKVDYPLALQHFNKAVEAQPDNIFLRYIAVQMAIYLGDTRQNKESIDFYDQALNHLKVIDASPTLNTRERERTENMIDLVGKLKDAVGQRDLMRTKHGRELAKQYAELIYNKAKEEEEKSNQSAEKEALKRAGVKDTSALSTDKKKDTDAEVVLSLYKRQRKQAGSRLNSGTGSANGQTPADATAAPDASGAGSLTPSPDAAPAK